MLLEDIKLDKDEIKWLYQFISNKEYGEYTILEELEDGFAQFVIGKTKDKDYYQKNITINP